MFLTSSIWAIVELKSILVIASTSRATMKWFSNSEDEASASGGIEQTHVHSERVAAQLPKEFLLRQSTYWIDPTVVESFIT